MSPTPLHSLTSTGGPTHDRIPGIFANLEYGLLLRFQFNPTEIEKSKTTSYEITSLPGVDVPLITWSSGGQFKLSFELYFDSSTSQSPINRLQDKLNIPQVGVLGEQAILESFLRPARSEDNKFVLEQIKKLTKKKIFNTQITQSPPDCYFIYGPLWFRGKLTSATVKESHYDKNLIPNRFTSQVTYVVEEQGALYRRYASQVRYLAVGTSAQNLATTAVDLLNSVRRIFGEVLP